MKRSDILVSAVLFVLIAAAILVSNYIQGRVDKAQRSITCTSAEANISQLEALREISRSLGLPTTFTIPPIPPECEKE